MQELSTTLLLSAYRRGWFPMSDPRTGWIEWYSPDPRAVFPLDAFHVPRSLAREVRRRRLEIRSDSAFEEVMRACAGPRGDDNGCWIDQRMIEAYVALHRIGHAHSVEAWLEGRLVGGLYGVQIGGAFFGESMFTRPDAGGSNASKVCLVHLVGWMRYRDMALLDTQFRTAHLDQFGCVEIRRRRYLARLAAAIGGDASWGRFDAEAARAAGEGCR